MDKPLLSYTIWLQLSAEQKAKLVRLFSIPRTGEVVVHVGEMMNNNIGAVAKQDGHRPEDLYAITSERMAELLNLPEKEGQTHDFYALYQEVIDNLDAIYAENFSEEVAETTSHTVPEVSTTPPEPVQEEEFVPRDPEELIKPKAPVAEESKPIKNAKAAKSSKTK